jgi:uncharacterized damage-inducible protein DinB
MSTRLPGFKGEYLWEFDIAEQNLLALAEAFPEERYSWRPAETARSVSEVLVHLGASGRMFLALLGVEAAEDLYGKLEGDGVAKAMAMFARNESLETSMTDKADVLALQRKSLNAVRTAFRETSDAELDRPEVFFGENTTVRRFYMRALCHLHEHMGQLTAYTRAMGMPAPWQAAREARRKEIERQLATAKK